MQSVRGCDGWCVPGLNRGTTRRRCGRCRAKVSLRLWSVLLSQLLNQSAQSPTELLVTCRTDLRFVPDPLAGGYSTRPGRRSRPGLFGGGQGGVRPALPRRSDPGRQPPHRHRPVARGAGPAVGHLAVTRLGCNANRLAAGTRMTPNRAMSVVSSQYWQDRMRT